MDHPYLCRLGDVGQAALSVSRAADHLGHRRSLRRPVPSRARRVPRRYRQRGLEFRGQAAIPTSTTLDFVNGMNQTSVNGDAAAKPQALFGTALTERLNDQFTHQFRCGFLVEQTPDPDNRVTLSEDFTDGLGLPRPQISYDVSDYTRKGYRRGLQDEESAVREDGRQGIHFDRRGRSDPVRRGDRWQEGSACTSSAPGTSWAPTAWAPTGSDSVVDHMQCSWDHRILFLVGSGTFPTGATANPTLTISALSLRTADHIVKNVLR